MSVVWAAQSKSFVIVAQAKTLPTNGEMIFKISKWKYIQSV